MSENLSFIIKALKIIGNNDLHRYLFYRVKDNDDVVFALICNDLFMWACSDMEELTPENSPILEQAIIDLNSAIGNCYNAPELFACRVREMRPQKRYYECLSKEIWHLFDACGEPRDD